MLHARPSGTGCGPHKRALPSRLEARGGVRLRARADGLPRSADRPRVLLAEDAFAERLAFCLDALLSFFDFFCFVPMLQAGSSKPPCRARGRDEEAEDESILDCVACHGENFKVPLACHKRSANKLG